ncbi:unnamed protein product [Rotaria sordida]|uniref:Major facilitator superfamily (MFS) profile domain-containing protein n=1 Tax=Rotaria sordida TaxID=392033 RepID=A0A819MGU0_9BILA|nr:unnamed protein product [Rotaria sordida]CAF3979488.1 unnamed protein product [Rotaria sordida]
MCERRSGISLDTKTIHNNDKLFTLTKDDQHHETILIDTLNDTTVDVNSINETQSKIKLVLDDIRVEPPLTGIFRCSNISARYIIATWAFFGFFCLYSLRVNLSVAIVAMATPQSALNESIQSCLPLNKNSTTPSPKYEFDWSPTLQGFILGAFFYGYITMQILAGNFAEKFGAKWIFGGCVLIAGLLTLLTPLAARTHVGLLIAIRFITGIVCGPGFPSAAALWGNWIPSSERSTIPPAAHSGANVGIIITAPLVSIMIAEHFLGGWPSAFYVFGVISCLWFFGWCIFGFNSPDQHPRISEKERIFLKQHIKTHIRQNRKTPWKYILRCLPLYGIIMMHVCHSYIYYTLLTSLPTYFATILNFNLHQNGLLSALPYFAQFLVTIIMGPIVDRIRRRNILSITILRKGQAIIGTLGTCSFLIGIAYMGCNQIGAVVCCIIAVGFLGLHTCGPLTSHLDIASNYAGTLMGITNSLAAIPGFIAPYVVGAITNKNQTIEAWRLIFNISAGIGVLGCVAYCILFNGEEQPWNRTPEARQRNESIASIDG